MCSNLFIFPTREESFGLVAPEVALASGCLIVANQSLMMMLEVLGHQALYFNFGSHHQTHNVDNEEAYFGAVANVIVARLRRNEAICTKAFVRQNYNWDSLYLRVYAPMLAEAETWV